MIYHLQSGVDYETGRRLKTAGATLLITIGLPTLVALLNKIEPFLLPSVRGAQTGQTSTEGSRNTSNTAGSKKDDAKTSAAPAGDPQAAPAPTTGTAAGSVSTSTVSRTINNVGVTGNSAVPSVGGYGSGPVSVSSTTPQQPVTISPSPGSIPAPVSTPTVPDTGDCLCSTLQGTIEPVKQTIEPVTKTVTDTTSSLGL